MLIVQRYPIGGLSRKIASDEVESDPWVNHVRGEALSVWRQWPKIYRWQKTIAERHFGKPDGTFKGEWFYRIYSFEAIAGDMRQRFFLWVDPDKAGKGSGIELLRPICEEMILPILEWTHEEWIRANPD